MHIMHVALGGCLRPPPVRYGITQDTGGHIAYLLGAAHAQVASSPGTRVTLVTRAFDDPALGPDHALERQEITARLTIRRLRTDDTRYLTKAALSAALPALSRAFRILVEHERPDVIHAHFADAAELALDAARDHGIPVLYTPHSLALDARGASARAGTDAARRIERERQAIRRAEAIIVSSDDERRHQVDAYGERASARTHVARPGIELATTRHTGRARALVDPWLDDPGRPCLLAIARPVAKKNLPTLVDAYAGDAWLREHANLIVLAGQHDAIRAERDEQADQLDAIERRIAEHGLAGSVALPPAHDRGHVAELYRLSACRGGVFVNPARHEPFGLTLVEAARFGLPVVATRHGGPVDILGTIGHGRLVDPDSAHALASACRSLLERPAEYAHARDAALRNRARYSWRAWAATVDGIMDRALRARAAQTRPAGTQCRARSAVSVPRPSHFLAFDIDDTLTGSRAAARRFAQWFHARPASLPVAVATGRELPEAMAVLARWRLPRPDTWITSVGAEIWRTDGAGELRRCPDHARYLSEDWNREAILGALHATTPRYQHECTQRGFKISLFGTSEDADRVRRHLAGQGLRVRVVSSHGRFIDILPVTGGKAAAIAFEAARHGVSMSHCVAAGNSGNDEDMLTHCGQAILVGNALPEISSIADRHGLYRARAAYADGVLEGLTAHGLIAPSAPRSRRAAALS